MKKILKRLFAFALFAFALLGAFAQNDINSIKKQQSKATPKLNSIWATVMLKAKA